MGRNSTSKIAHLRGVQFAYDTSLVIGRIVDSIEAGVYELPEALLVESAIMRGDRVLDIGAGLGFLTFLSMGLGASCAFAYEPHPEIFKLLKKTSELNERFNVEIFNKAVSIDVNNDTRNFFLRDAFWSSSLDPGTKPYLRNILCDVDNVCEILKKTRPDVVILDCEGEEKSLLGEIFAFKPREIIAEIHRKKTDERFDSSEYVERNRIIEHAGSYSIWLSRR